MYVSRFPALVAVLVALALVSAAAAEGQGNEDTAAGDGGPAIAGDGAAEAAEDGGVVTDAAGTEDVSPAAPDEGAAGPQAPGDALQASCTGDYISGWYGDYDGTPCWDYVFAADNPTGSSGRTWHMRGDGDEAHAQNGADTVYGDDGNDELHGDDGFDALRGGAGPDTLRGGEGNDDIQGGDGTNDVCYGGAGTDSFSGCEEQHQD